MILVIGATGKVGTHLVTQLQTQQQLFRVLAHSSASFQRLTAQGVDIRLVNTSEPSSTAMQAAFEGIDQMFLLTPNTLDRADARPASARESNNFKEKRI